MTGDDRADRITMVRFLEALKARGDEDDFSQRTVHTYMLGVYLAVNALEDAYLLVEGPDCAYMKTQYIQGNHDWMSTLTSVSGFHRIANTALHPSMMTDSREEPLHSALARMAEDPAVSLLLLTSMPMAFVTGADYQRLTTEIHRNTGKQVLHVPGLSLSGDWLDGYAETMKALARGLDLTGGRPDPKKVAVVGYLFDRNEDDHRANIEELRSMCSAVGADLVSIWLSGQKCRDLKAIKDAGTVVALPYGKKAARAVARQTGADVLSLDLPFGLDACERWMRTLGQRFAAEKAARDYMNRQMAVIAPRVEWIIPYLFQSLKAGYVGDPYLLAGFKNTVELLGAELCFAVVTNRAAHLAGRADELSGVQQSVRPTLREFVRFLLENTIHNNIRLIVSNNFGITFPLADTALVEFGFPSVYTHALYPRPFLGYGGFMAFVDTLANALRQKELARAQPVFPGLNEPLQGEPAPDRGSAGGHGDPATPE